MIKLNLETKGYLQVRENIFDLSKNILSEFNIVFKNIPLYGIMFLQLIKLKKFPNITKLTKFIKKY